MRGWSFFKFFTWFFTVTSLRQRTSCRLDSALCKHHQRGHTVSPWLNKTSSLSVGGRQMWEWQRRKIEYSIYKGILEYQNQKHIFMEDNSCSSLWLMAVRLLVTQNHETDSTKTSRQTLKRMLIHMLIKQSLLNTSKHISISIIRGQ